MSGAIDSDWDANELEAEEQLAERLDDLDAAPHSGMEPGDIAIDLVNRQPLVIVDKSADSLAEFFDDDGMDLATYKQHSFLPVRLDDPVFECVFIGELADLHSFSSTYDYPAGRLARVPIELAGGD